MFGTIRWSCYNLKMAAFPLGKLLYLGMRQISKPIAYQLKNTAKRSPFFRKYICSPPAQALHKLEMFVKFRLMGAKGHVEYAALSEEKAVEQGAEMLGELFIYATAAGYIVYEYWKGVKKEHKKESSTNEHITELQDKIMQLDNEVALLTTRIRSLEQIKKSDKTPKK